MAPDNSSLNNSDRKAFMMPTLTLIAGTDPVALDAYAAKTYLNLDADSLPF